MASTHDSSLILYGYYRSSCSARLRIALNLKAIAYSSVYVNIKDDEHLHTDYTNLNPSATVPTLIYKQDGDPDLKITQSTAALELLEEVYSGAGMSLLPPDTIGRAHVRALMNIISCDIQPPTNMKILKRVGTLGGNGPAWAKELMEEGLASFEAVAQEVAGRFSYEDDVSLADVCLIPAIWNAERYEVDMSAYPTVMRIYQNAGKLAAVAKAHWQKQPDCPEELR